MTLPNMPSPMVSREFLRVGGGYGAPIRGNSPAGGLDIDNAGNLAADGQLTLGGPLDLHGPLHNSTGPLAVESPLQLGPGGVNKLWSTWLLPENAIKSPTDGPAGPTVHWNGNFNGAYTTLDYDHVTRQFAAWRVPLPPDYDGSDLAATLYWTAHAGTIGQQVVWRVHMACINDAGDLGATLPAFPAFVEEYQGSGLAHVANNTSIVGASSNGGLLLININRQTANIYDTLESSGKLIAANIFYA